MSFVLNKTTRQASKEQQQLQKPETALSFSAQTGKKTHVILAEPGRLYRLVDTKTGDTVRPLQVERQKRKLVVQLEDEQTLEILDFFEEVPGSPKSEYLIEGAPGESTALSVGSDLSWGGAAPTDSAQVLWTPMGVNSLFLATGLPGGLPFAGAVAASAIHMGEDKAKADITATPTGSVVKGQFMAGPVLVDHDLVVHLYDQDGKLLGSAQVDANGRFSINIGNYMGPVLAKVFDAPASQRLDFFDEATQSGKDLNAFMMAVEVVTSLNTVITLNVNEATTVAARLAGFNPVDGSGGFNPSTAVASIKSANTAVSQLISLNEPLTSAQVQPVFMANGQRNPAANAIGQFLAALSGMAEDQNGDMGTAINALVAGMDKSAASPALTPQAQAALLKGSASASVPSATLARMLDASSPDQALAVDTRSVKQLAELTPVVAAHLSPAQMAAITNASALPALTMGVWSPEQIQALASGLLKQLSTVQVAQLSPTQSGALSLEQAGALAPEQVANLKPDSVASLGLPVIGGLQGAQIAALTAAQVAAMRPEQLAALSAAQLAMLPSTTLSVLIHFKN